MSRPHIWSESWLRNFEAIAAWSLAASHFCQISPLDYTYYVQHTSCLIKADDVQTAVLNFGMNFGHLLEWIQDGIQILNESPHVRNNCMIKPIALSSFGPIWKKHVNGTYQNPDELHSLETLLINIHDDITDKISLFKECSSSDEYSSYSDYSEEDTESSEEEEEEEEKVMGARRRR